MLTLSNKRLDLFFANWYQLHQDAPQDFVNKDNDVLLIMKGDNKECAINERTTAFFRSIFPGVEVQNISMCLKRKNTNNLAKALIIVPEATTINVPPECEEYVTVRTIASNLDSVLEDLKSYCGNHHIGCPLKELQLQTGLFANLYKKLIDNLAHQYTITESALSIGMCLRVKDEDAILNINKSGALCNAIHRYFIIPSLSGTTKEIMPFFGSNADFAQSIASKIKTPSTISQLKTMNASAYSASLVPVVHSGIDSTEVNLSIKNSVSTPLELIRDCITVATSTRCNYYSAYCARSYMFKQNCNDVTIKAYEYALSLLEFMVEQIKKCVTFSQVANAVVDHARQLNPETAKYLDQDDFGSPIGLSILETKSIINSSNDKQMFQVNACYVVRIAIAPYVSASGMRCGPILLADTITLAPDPSGSEKATVRALTRSKKELPDVLFETDIPVKPRVKESVKQKVTIKQEKAPKQKAQREVKHRHTPKVKRSRDDSEIEEIDSSDESTTDVKAESIEDNYDRPITRSATGLISKFTLNEQRQQKQLEIFEQRKKEWDCSGGAEEKKNTEDMTVTELGKLASGMIRVDTSANSEPLVVDRQNRTVALPIGNKVEIFHIATIQKVELKPFIVSSTLHKPDPVTAAATNTLRVVMYNIQESNPSFRINRSNAFIKELSVTSGDVSRLRNAMVQIQEIMQEIKAMDLKARTTHGTIQHDATRLKRRANPPRLMKIKCRPPPMSGFKHGCIGDLEAHDNGFLFVYSGGPPLAIMFDNIKHAIFQPAQNDPATVFHLTLKQPLLTQQGKKVEDVQFIAEVVDQSEAVRNYQKSYEEELEHDEIEAQRIKRTNIEFAMFSKRLEDEILSTIPLKQVEMPQKGFSFTGNTARSMAKLRANNRVLWAINELPFWTQNLSEVEIVSLERIYPGGANWDMRFVHKGYKKVTELTNIPTSHLDSIKDWLTSASQLYFESTINLNWTQLLKVIREDKEWDPYGESGWRSYLQDSESEEEEETDEETNEETEDSESDATSWGEEVSESDGPSSYDESESDASWDEMERRAENEDRNKKSKRSNKHNRSSSEYSTDSEHNKKMRTKQKQKTIGVKNPGLHRGYKL